MSESPEPNHDSQSTRIRQAVLAHLRHEMRTPIQAIIGYADLLINDAATRSHEIFVPDLKKILSAGHELLRLVDELLDGEKSNAPPHDIKKFGHDIRHALRNPLSAAKGYCELLLEDAEPEHSDDLVPDLKQILESCERLLGLLNEIVWLSQLDNGVVNLDPQENAAIMNTLDSIQPLSINETYLVEGGSLLLVDDDCINRDLLSRRLKQDGHRVVTANDGYDALATLRAEKFDIVLLDLVMPVMNGYQVLREMKTDPNLRNIPVIMLSVLEETDSIVRCIQMGADDYLTKPFNPIILKARINASLEKKRLRERVERLAHIGEAISGLAHCVKNILNGINAGSYILESQNVADGSSKIWQGWKSVKRNIRLLSDVVLDMLAYAKERKPMLYSCNLQDLASDVLTVTQDQATERQIELILECDPHAPLIALLDEAAIRRCLINLIGNAIDACVNKENAKITLKIGRKLDTGGFSLYVTDNGKGIAENLLSQLFTPFFSTKGNRGTGLGLAVTQKLIREHGGSIAVHSEIGIGTTFSLEFPSSCLPAS